MVVFELLLELLLVGLVVDGEHAHTLAELVPLDGAWPIPWIPPKPNQEDEAYATDVLTKQKGGRPSPTPVDVVSFAGGMVDIARSQSQSG